MTIPWPARLRALRVLVAVYVATWTVVRSAHLLDTADLAARRLDPVGPLWFLSGPVPGAVIWAAVIVTPVAAAALAAGARPRLSGPVAAVGFVFLTTYRNSWGQLFHTENLVALHLVVLAVGALGGSGPADDGYDEEAEWQVRAMAVLTVLTYFIAGVAKLRISGWDWIDGDVLRHQVAFDNARKELLGDRSAPLAPWFLGQSWLLMPAVVATMVVELAAPFALLGRRVAQAWAAAAVGFHVAIVAVMWIVFPYHLLAIALAPLLPVERLGATVAGWRRRFRPLSTSAPPSG